MKIIEGIIVLAVIILLGVFIFNIVKQTAAPTERSFPVSPTSPSQPADLSTTPRTTVLTTHLTIPWSMVFLPDKRLLFTERGGKLKVLEVNGTVSTLATLPDVKEYGEGGLLGITLHPHFSQNHYLYLYYTYSSNGNNTLNRVVRYTFEQNTLKDPVTLIDAIPGAIYHDGGRLKFGTDKYLYITTGDAQDPSHAQDLHSLAGKILRVTDDGKPAPGNPFGSTEGKPSGDPRIYSYGHRNPQGIAWDSSGRLWSTEHGRSGALSGLDELNLIEKGKNYGWPDSQGNTVKPGTVGPIRNSGSETWAPSGMAYYNGALYFAGLKGQALYKATLSGTNVTLTSYLKNEFGRIRDVIVGPDNLLYICTSNEDGRGNPTQDDDRIIRVNPTKL